MFSELSLRSEKDRKIEDEHIDKPQFVKQKEHPRKFANTIKTERHPRAKNENEDALKHTQKEQPGTKKGGIPTKFQHCKQNE